MPSHGDSECLLFVSSHYFLLNCCRDHVLSSITIGGKKVFKSKLLSVPKEPMEKFKLRVQIGRKTGRMDLACKQFWPQHQSRPPTQPPIVANKTVELPKNTEPETNEEGIELVDLQEEEDIAPLFVDVDVDQAVDRQAPEKELGLPSDDNNRNVSGKPDVEFRLFKLPPDVFRFTGKFSRSFCWPPCVKAGN
jgi:hypothetical protein